MTAGKYDAATNDEPCPECRQTKQRNIVERCINKHKQFRVVATRDPAG